MRNNAHGGARILLVLAAFLMAGCSSLGKDSILFVTKTSVGVDVDSKPPTLVIGFDRKEGTIAPEFDTGEVLPQMAGFTTDLGFINQAVGQSFATGNAAVLMSQYLASIAGPDPKGPIDIKKDFSKPQSVTTNGRRKRYFFGTDTSFAFKVGFGLETGGLPDSLSLGYKRKELAFVPLFEVPDSDANGTGMKKVNLPSLLATAGLVTVVDPKKPERTKVVHTQFFATGLAATYLAALPEIRAVVAPKILPEAKETVELSLAAARASDLLQRSYALDAILCYQRLNQTDKFRAWNHMVATGLAETDADYVEELARKSVDKTRSQEDRDKDFKEGERVYRGNLAIAEPLNPERAGSLLRHRDLACALAG